MIKDFAKWVKEQLKKGVPEEVKAFNFNLYESDEETEFDIQLVGCPQFDADNDDWACDEIFSSGEDLFRFKAEDWEKAEIEAQKIIMTYLESDNCDEVFKGKHIAYGFVDGDLHLIR